MLSILLLCTATVVKSQSVRQYDQYDRFEVEVLKRSSKDTIYVVNFWATWCAPCVHELPFFDGLDGRVDDHPIKVILASLDFSRQLDTKFYPWLKDHPQDHEVVLLLDPKSNTWIDKVDATWSGAIPFTYVYYRGKRSTYEGSFASAADLDNYINQFIKSL